MILSTRTENKSINILHIKHNTSMFVKQNPSIAI
jgi:hypothetical protein